MQTFSKTTVSFLFFLSTRFPKENTKMASSCWVKLWSRSGPLCTNNDKIVRAKRDGSAGATSSQKLEGIKI